MPDEAPSSRGSDRLRREALEQMIDAGLSTRQIADQVGVGRSRIRAALARHDLTTGFAARPSRPTGLDDREWLIDVYVSQQTSLARIAETLGCSPTTVHAALVDHGIDIRTSDDFSHVEALRDPRWLKNRYVDQQRTIREIANELGCSHVTVDRAIRAQGINARPSQPRSADRPPARVGPPSEAEIQVSTLRVIHELGHQVDVAEVRSFIEQRWQHSRLARDVVDLALAHFRRRIDRA